MDAEMTNLGLIWINEMNPQTPDACLNDEDMVNFFSFIKSAVDNNAELGTEDIVNLLNNANCNFDCKDNWQDAEKSIFANKYYDLYKIIKEYVQWAR